MGGGGEGVDGGWGVGGWGVGRGHMKSRVKI